MDSRIDQLSNSLNNNGWEIVGSIDQSIEWWAEDILELRSQWNPINKKIYLTLLIDPEIVSEKKIWAVGLSDKIPENHLDECLIIQSLNNLSKGGQELIVKKAEDLRLS